ncbi:MAG: zinc metallopeptidase [Eubacterium sp.]|nr:zinc metallopeptidase [Eubacterium sp.]
MFYYDITFILLIPAMIFSMIASGSVRSTFSNYSGVRVRRGITGAQAARMLLDANGLTDVRIEAVAGSLTDNYDPRTRVVHLSQPVCNAASISAVAVACHECGHALQHAYGYTPLTVRSSIVPVVNFASRFSWIFIIIGLVLMGQGLYTSGGSNVGTLVFDIGVIAYLVVLAFHLVTLPVEFNASSRALKQMETMQIVDSDELTGAKKVLKAAAMTYVASTAMVIAQLLRLLVLRGRRN